MYFQRSLTSAEKSELKYNIEKVNKTFLADPSDNWKYVCVRRLPFRLFH